MPYFSPLWFGSKVGVANISPSNNYLHICYQSSADLALNNDGKRLANQDTSSYEVQVTGIGGANANNPELNYFFTEYAGTVNDSAIVSFAVWPYPGSILNAAKQVYPA